VTRGQASPTILASYDQERRPHARKIINLARFLGALVMPSNRLAAFVVHGLISAARVLPAGRALFEDLKIKPENTFEQGLFWRHRATRRLNAGSSFPQGWIRPADSGEPTLSDDVLGPYWALIGFGVDPATLAEPALLARWERAGGKVWQWCQRAQAQHLAPSERRLEALDEAVLPLKVPLGWVALVRPDRCVLAEGPVEETNRLLQQALERLGAASSPAATRPRASFITSLNHSATMKRPRIRQ
jgi:3-(3-hydroxy-phenyl)propionate hydroxylase